MVSEVTATQLGCRSFFRVADQPDLDQKVREQLHAWMRTKAWNRDELSEDGPVEIADGVIGSILRDEPMDGSSTVRYRFVQRSGGDVWITETTNHTSRDNDGWVWTDVQGPTGRTAKVPRLVRNILEVVTGLDGAHLLTAEPARAFPDDVSAIVGALTDAERRGFLYLAGSDNSMPFAGWKKLVSSLLKDTRGIASAHVLDPEATRLFNERVPRSHQVAPWTIRTFDPRIDLSNPLDSARHRILSTGRIADGDERYLRELLSRRACAISVSNPLPREIIRLDRRLRRALDEKVLSTFDTPEVSPPAAEPPARRVVEQPVADHDDDQSLVIRALKTALDKVLGSSTVTADAINRLGAIALDSVRGRKNVDVLRSRLDLLESNVSTLEDEKDELVRQREDEVIERAEIQAELDDAARQLRYLRLKMSRAGLSQDAWAEPDVDPMDLPPDSVYALIERIPELRNIRFTGDPAAAHDLDTHNPLDTWARTTWTALRALNDYARVRTSGEFSGGVKEYLEQTPDGCVSYSPNRHTPHQTSATETSKKFGKIRTFPVPADVEPSGEIFMGAHFKIAQSGMISPRLHYYNDVANSGLVYVGYIGRHLDNFRTN